MTPEGQLARTTSARKSWTNFVKIFFVYFPLSESALEKTHAIRCIFEWKIFFSPLRGWETNVLSVYRNNSYGSSYLFKLIIQINSGIATTSCAKNKTRKANHELESACQNAVFSAQSTSPRDHCAVAHALAAPTRSNIINRRGKISRRSEVRR